MANKRQRLAKKRFSGSQQGATPVASTQTQAAAKKQATSLTSSSHKIAKKHPLRVAGKKPGDGCFICKSPDHVARACPQKLGKDRKMICLLCRKLGHTLKNCPSELDGQEKKCYNCGESGHRLAECKEPLKDGGTTFAACFLCKQEGHLSKNCPSNQHGIYPKGGACKICGGVTHLAKDCPEKSSMTRSNGAQQRKLLISKDAAPTSGVHAKRIVFGSGDDLEDDFVGEEGDKSEANKENGSLKPKRRGQESKAYQIGLSSLKPVVKKAMKSPKVVNFK
eukprot:c18451_g1_i1 orf=156-992(+)